MHLDCAGTILDLSEPQVMGILNVTPDSFSDGGRFVAHEKAVAHARAMVAEGAAIIDVGGESTRPGAAAVAVQEELDRVIPIIEALRAALQVIVSVDTSKPEVMRAAVAAGAGLINDVRALREPGALEAAAAGGVPVCLMHMQGEPRSMQHAPTYTDVVEDVRNFLLERAAACRAAGIPEQQLLLDPGFGFGKTLEHNLRLLKHLPVLVDEGYPVLAGLSRKSMIGARVLRVHDVAETVQALRLCRAVQTAD